MRDEQEISSVNYFTMHENYDHKSLFLEILQKHSIPYEYDESERTFTVYGYK